MASTALRQFASARLLPIDVEALSDRHATLVRERQELRSGGAALEQLERNRLAIVECQWQLSQALIARHLVPITAA
jgi:FtsZ-binding cell division protein ZapB